MTCNIHIHTDKLLVTSRQGSLYRMAYLMWLVCSLEKITVNVPQQPFRFMNNSLEYKFRFSGQWHLSKIPKQDTRPCIVNTHRHSHEHFKYIYIPSFSSYSPIFAHLWDIWLENPVFRRRHSPWGLMSYLPFLYINWATTARHRRLFSKQPKRSGKKGWLDNLSGKIIFLPYLTQLMHALESRTDKHNSVPYAVIKLFLACFSEPGDSVRVRSNLLF